MKGHKLMVSENGVQRGISGPKGEEATECRK